MKIPLDLAEILRIRKLDWKMFICLFVCLFVFLDNIFRVRLLCLGFHDRNLKALLHDEDIRGSAGSEYREKALFLCGYHSTGAGRDK